MDENGGAVPSLIKKKGRPKGRKDGPRPTGAPKRGRPKKKLDNSGNNVVIHGVHGACCRFKLR